MRLLTEVGELSRLGGIEVTLVEDTAALTARGHDVHVVFGPDDRGNGDLRADLEAAGATLHGPHLTSWTPARTPADLRRYVPSARLVGRLRPDVLWLQRFEHALWARVATARTRTPILCHLHHAPNYQSVVQRFLARGISRYLAVSEFTRQQWVDRGLAPSRVRVVYNAVSAVAYPLGGDAETSAARSALGIPQDAHVALHYGLLSRGKGTLALAQAWPSILAREPSAHLLVAGTSFPGDPDDPEGALRRGTAEGGSTFLGMQRDVVPLLHAADLVLFPTQLMEAFGRVVLESLSSGRPVLASRVGALPELMTGDLSQLLVPADDPVALADATVGHLRWRERDPDLGRRWSAEVAARFDPNLRIQRVEHELAQTARRATGSGSGPGAS